MMYKVVLVKRTTLANVIMVFVYRISEEPANPAGTCK